MDHIENTVLLLLVYIRFRRNMFTDLLPELTVLFHPSRSRYIATAVHPPIYSHNGKCLNREKAASDKAA
jgi:hypothetical protein